MMYHLNVFRDSIWSKGLQREEGRSRERAKMQKDEFKKEDGGGRGRGIVRAK
jgi:hypothetical protein